jgi:hypothetical protein
MAGLQQLMIHGRPATVAFMTAFDGRLVDEKDASVAIVNFDDGEIGYYQFVDQPKTLGDKEGHDFHGNQWNDIHVDTTSDHPPSTNPLIQAFMEERTALQAPMRTYLAAHGEEFHSQDLMHEYGPRGKSGQCFENATRLVMNHPNLTYAEGFVVAKSPYVGGPPTARLHGWAVDVAGRVYDNTLKDPYAARYFGVRYDRLKYLTHVAETGIFGVMGNSNENTTHALKTGGKDLR